MANVAKNEVTRILRGNGANVTEELLPIVYAELRSLAAAHLRNEKAGNTLQPTALVHEAYLRLVDSKMEWINRGHFFAAAARSMRQILTNRAISKKSERRGGGRSRQEFNEELFVSEPPPERILAIDQAIEKLEQIDKRKAKIVMLRYFTGLSIEETAKALDISPATIKRDWKFTRAWLQREINDDRHSP